MASKTTAPTSIDENPIEKDLERVTFGDYLTDRQRDKYPTFDTRPRMFLELLDDWFFCGLPGAILAIIPAGLLVVVGPDGNGAPWMGPGLWTLWFFSLLIFIPIYIQALPVFLLGWFHPFVQKMKIKEWAENGWYVEHLEPKGYDLSTLDMLSRADILAIKNQKRRSGQ